MANVISKIRRIAFGMIIGLFAVVVPTSFAERVETEKIIVSNDFTVSGTATLFLIQGNAYGITNAPHNSGFDSPTDVKMTFTNATRTFNLAPSGSSYKVAIYSRWKTVTNSVETVLPDVEGTHFIYFDAGGNITNSTTVWPIAGEAQVSIVYWDSTNKIASMIADERHGNKMDDATHKYLHTTIGTRWSSGGTLISHALASGTPNANGSNTTVSITTAGLADEDISFSITTNNQSLGNQSSLSSSNDAALFPVLHATGLVANLQWRLTTPEVWPFTYNNTTATYNQLVSGAWTLTPVPEDNYFAVWIFGTDSITNGATAIMHHTVYPTLAGIQTGAAPETIFVNRTSPILPEMKLLYRLVYLFNAVNPTPFDQAVKCSRLTEVVDYRTDNTRPINATPAQSHGALTGLLNDDHPQYLPVDGSRMLANGVTQTTDAIRTKSAVVVGAIDAPITYKPTVAVNGLPLVRAAPGVASLNSNIYVFGSSTDGGAAGSTNVFKFDGVAWTSVNGLPLTRADHYAITYKTNIYLMPAIVSGSDGAGNTNILRFDGTTFVNVESPGGYKAGGVVVYSNYLYSIGGYVGANKTNVFRYDGATWTEVAGLMVADRSLAAAVISNKIYISQGSLSVTNAYWFDGTAWSQAVGPILKDGGAHTTFKDKLYSIGGTVATNAFSFDGLTWTQVPGLTVGKTEPRIPILNGRIYGIGGTSTGVDMFYSFSAIQTIKNSDSNNVVVISDNLIEFTKPIVISQQGATNDSVLVSKDTTGEGKWQGPVYFTAYANTAVVLTNGAYSPIKFDVETEDVGGGYDPTTSKFTAPVSGRYTFQASVYIISATTGSRNSIALSTNNANDQFEQSYYYLCSATDSMGVQGVWDLTMTNGQSVYITVDCNGGANRTNYVLNSPYLNKFKGRLTH